MDNGDSVGPHGERRIGAFWFTRREQEILPLLAKGLTNRQISAQLIIAVSTAGNEVQAMFNLTGMHTRAALATFYVYHCGNSDTANT